MIGKSAPSATARADGETRMVLPQGKPREMGGMQGVQRGGAVTDTVATRGWDPGSPGQRVHRHRFIPDRIWELGSTDPLNRHVAPDRWQQLVAADTAVVTQIDEERAEGMGVPTSSSSAPV